MQILSVDTATMSCSVAITDGNALLAEATIITKQTHAKHLMEMIDTVINLSGVAIDDLSGFAVTRGPGSFTGMRIGISTVKGLATATHKPIVGVSTLDVLAMQSTSDSNLICPLLDARKGEVYFSRYRFEKGVLQKKNDEQVSSPEKAVEGIKEDCHFIGSGAVLYRDRIADKLGEYAYFEPEYQHTIRASTIGYLSVTRFDKNDTDDIEGFVPTYIRASDAELNRKKKTMKVISQ